MHGISYVHELETEEEEKLCETEVAPLKLGKI